MTDDDRRREPSVERRRSGSGPARALRLGAARGVRLPGAALRRRHRGRGPHRRDVPRRRVGGAEGDGADDDDGVADRRGPAQARRPLAQEGARRAQPPGRGRRGRRRTTTRGTPTSTRPSPTRCSAGSAPTTAPRSRCATSTACPSPRWPTTSAAPSTPPRPCSCGPAWPSAEPTKGATVADPLDALRQPDAPVAPNPAFAAQLRRRLTDLLDPTPPGGTMTITEPAVRTGLQLRPYLVVDGADAAIAFYADVFGARVVGDLIRGDDGRVGHCELDIAGNGLYLADAYPEYGIPAPDPAVGVSLHLEVADADATVDRAEAAGAHGAAAGRGPLLRLPLRHRPRPVRPPVADRRARHVAPERGRRASAGWPTTASPTRRSTSATEPPADPPTRTELAAANAVRTGRRLLHHRRPGPRPGGRVLRRPVRLGRPAERPGLPHRERLAPGRDRRLRHRARASRSSSGSTTSRRPPPGSASSAARSSTRRSTRPAATPAASTTRASRSSSGSPPPATDPGGTVDTDDQTAHVPLRRRDPPPRPVVGHRGARLHVGPDRRLRRDVRGRRSRRPDGDDGPPGRRLDVAGSGTPPARSSSSCCPAASTSSRRSTARSTASSSPPAPASSTRRASGTRPTSTNPATPSSSPQAQGTEHRAPLSPGLRHTARARICAMCRPGRSGTPVASRRGWRPSEPCDGG